MVRPAHVIRVLVSPLLVPRRPMSPIMVMLESNDGSMVLLKVHRLVDAVLSLTRLVLGCVPNVRVYSVPACVLPKHELFLGIMAIGVPVVAPVTFLLCYIGRITIRWYYDPVGVAKTAAPGRDRDGRRIEHCTGHLVRCCAKRCSALLY